MNINEYKIMADLEKEYWWHKGKVHLIEAMIKKYFGSNRENPIEIMEIGCGTGGVTSILLNYGNVTAIDISEEAVTLNKESGVKNAFCGDVNDMDLSPYEKKFDLILALDVLEHIQDDIEAMRRVHYMLKDNGMFFINVPAHKFLWSEHDEALHHKRRYHSFEMISKLKDTSFTILKKSYFVTFTSPIIILYRIWGNLFGKSAYPKTSYVMLPEIINNFFINILKLEVKMVEKFNLPFGVTLTVVARKK